MIRPAPARHHGWRGSRYSLAPNASAFQPMPVFCVHPNKWPEGHSFSSCGVRGREPVGPGARAGTSYKEGSAESKGFVMNSSERIRPEISLAIHEVVEVGRMSSAGQILAADTNEGSREIRTPGSGGLIRQDARVEMARQA